MNSIQVSKLPLSDLHPPGINLLNTPIKWLHHQVSQLTSLSQGERLSNPMYVICEKIARLVYAFLLPVALSLAALSVLYCFVVTVLTPKDLSRQPLCQVEQKPSEMGAPTTVAPSAHTINPELKAILEDLGRLRFNFEQLFIHLDWLKGESGREMDKRFNQLAQRFEPYKNDDNGRTDFIAFNEMKLQYDGLRRGRVSLFYDPPRLDERSGTMPVADRGNCLYNAVIVAIDLYNCRASSPVDMSDSCILYPLDSAALRRDVVKWESNNVNEDEELRKRIMGAIATILFDTKKRIEEEESSIQLKEELGCNQAQERKELKELKEAVAPYQNSSTCISHYLQQASRPGVWGTEAELYAIAQMYQIGIYVQAVRRTVTRDGQNTDEHLPDYDVTLFSERPKQMKLKNINGVHYEPLIEKS